MSRRRESLSAAAVATLLTVLCACSASSNPGCPDGGGLPDLAVSGMSVDISILHLPVGSAVRLSACETAGSLCGHSSLTLSDTTPSTLPLSFAFPNTATVDLTIEIAVNGATVLKQDVPVTPKTVKIAPRACVNDSLNAALRISRPTGADLVIQQVR